MQGLIIFIFFLVLLSAIAYWYLYARNPSRVLEAGPQGIGSPVLKPISP